MPLLLVLLPLIVVCFSPPEPDRQFQLVTDHIERLRKDLFRTLSPVRIYVERNLGFEAEHHQRALGHLLGVEFYVDAAAARVGVLTTNETKHAMCTVLSTMMRERRVHVRQPVTSRDPASVLVRLREQLEIYSYQFKAAVNTFTQDRIALSGKVGGMKDDLCICLQLGAYWTNVEVVRQRAALGL